MSVAFSRDGKAGIVFTRSWYYLYGVDDRGMNNLKAGVLGGGEVSNRLSTLDQSGKRIQVVYKTGANTLGLEDVELDKTHPTILTGDLKELLGQWQIKLGLEINDEGRIKRRGAD